MRRAAGAATWAVVALVSGQAPADPLTDLHEIAVGMSAEQLPATGYRDFRCVDRAIATWRAWATCPATGPDGRRAVHVAYDQPGGETKVAGHPVYLTVFFDGAGRLAEIEIRTNDHAAPFLHKKAYMLARQAKAHYGEDNWTCTHATVGADEEPIGKTYVNESCVKQSPERRIEMSDRLFRLKGADPRTFVSETRITIALPATQPPGSPPVSPGR